MNEMTLRQLCKECGVSRRAVQGYEKYGLVKSTGKTNRGYLIYNTEAAEKVKSIKSLQNYGFTLKEILKFQTADIPTRHTILEEKLIGLETKRAEIEKYIVEIQKLL